MKLEDLREALGVDVEGGPTGLNCFFTKNAVSNPRARKATEWFYKGRYDIWKTYQSEQGGDFVTVMEAKDSKKQFVYIFIKSGDAYVFHKCYERINSITVEEAIKDGLVPNDYEEKVKCELVDSQPYYIYKEYKTPGELEDRLVIKYDINRKYNLTWDRIKHEEVLEILPPRKAATFFRTYMDVSLDYGELCRVLKDKDWITHLKQQQAVYLILDEKTGKQYVGASYGENGLFGRWKDYAETLTGGNTELVRILEKEGEDYIKEYFRYSILEVFSLKQDKYISESERLWKKKLGSRTHGLNDN